MRNRIVVLAMVAAVAVTGRAGAQIPGAELDQIQVTRESLLDLQQRLEAAANSSNYSGEVRARAREMARRVAARLADGDFNPGDRIFLRVEGESTLSDTFVVRTGRSLRLPNIGDIPVSGVLRSELDDHLTRELRRYLRDPVVHAQSLIRLTVTGAVGSQGFYTVPVDVGVNEVLRAAGGIAGNARIDRLRIRRGDETLFGPEQVERAITIGASLDAIGLQAGDRIEVPAQPTRNWWATVQTFNGLIALTVSLLALGNRL